MVLTIVWPTSAYHLIPSILHQYQTETWCETWCARMYRSWYAKPIHMPDVLILFQYGTVTGEPWFQPMNSLMNQIKNIKFTVNPNAHACMHAVASDFICNMYINFHRHSLMKSARLHLHQIDLLKLCELIIWFPCMPASYALRLQNILFSMNHWSD